MKKIMFPMLLAIGLVATSCNLDYFPSDELNSEAFLQDEKGISYMIDGCYSLLKDETDYLNYPDGNTYIRHYTQLTEFPGDNICLSNRTSDPLYQSCTLTMYSSLNNHSVIWWLGYKIIFSVNTCIEKYQEGESDKTDQLLGEAYFLRAMEHFHLVTMFARPYTFDNGASAGVPLRISTNTNETSRATVKEVYDQIVADLIKASTLMKPGTKRGNGGYACYETAMGLLSRVYLYMGEDQKVVETVDKMLGGADPASKLSADYTTYFVNAPSDKETLFCVIHTALETRAQGSIGSMYLHDDEQSIGWGEIYPSDPLMDLYERYPMDKRISYLRHTYPKGEDGPLYIYFPGMKQDDACRLCLWAPVTGDAASGYKFKYENKDYTVSERMVNGEYKQYYVKNYNGAGFENAPEDLDARIMVQHKPAENAAVPVIYMTKYSYQDGDCMLSSPVLLRWAEVILNRAEAYAKLGQTDKALADVNVIRTRAGIPADGMFSSSNMHGYTDVLDIVLDERRMELAFEGHRVFDQIRNKRDINRQFPGVQKWEVVKYDDPRLQYPIPFDEVSTSGIQQNPGY